MSLNDLMTDDGSSDYYDPSFRDVLEAHLTWLRKSPNTYSIAVTAFDAHIYHQNLHGFLINNQVPLNLHWLVMRMNGFYSPFELDAKTTSLLIPNSKEVDRLRQSWNTTAVIVR